LKSENFGDRVKYWLTFNEPLSFSVLGYDNGIHAPGRCSDRSTCPTGDSSTEPYIVSHNVLLSHSAAVNSYRTKYQSQQKGKIGITLNCDWAEPYSSSSDDVDAAERHLEFNLAWFADPVFFGDYPEVMKERVGNRLPNFTDEQKQALKGSHDFFGLNHYTTQYVINDPTAVPGYYEADQGLITTPYSQNGTIVGPQADSSWLFDVPWGIRKMLNWVAARYGNPLLYITENGVDVPNESSMSLDEALDDTFRINFLEGYLDNVGLAIGDGCQVKGYFVWSLLDNFEWADGYTKRFGIHYVDYNNNMTRYQKNSALWYSDYIKSHSN